MKLLKHCIAVSVMLGAFVAPWASAAESPSVLLQRGIYAEETERNLDAAIKIYEQIAAEAAANSSILAQAKYRLAVCYQMKGNKDQAVALLNQLMLQPPSDAALTQKARELLAVLGQMPAESVTIRQLAIVGSEVAHFYGASRDGRLIAYRSRGATNQPPQFSIFEPATGKTWMPFRGNTNITPPQVGSAAFSPDGRRIAFAGGFGVYVANIDGSDAKLIAKKPTPGRSPFIIDWLPNREALIVNTWDTNRDTIGALDLGTGAITTIVETAGDEYHFTRLSPSGRYLAYSTEGDTNNSQRVKLLDLESRSESILVSREAGDVFGWSPDESRVVFSSERTGEKSLWALPVRDGKPMGEPELVRANFRASAEETLLAGDGRLYYLYDDRPGIEGTYGRAGWVYVANVNFETGEILSEPRRVTQSFPGGQRLPHWSQDGKELLMEAYRDNIPKQFVSVSLASGDYTAFPPSPIIASNGLVSLDWSRAGGFALVGTDMGDAEDDWGGIYRYDLASGKTEPLLLSDSTNWVTSPYEPVQLTPDGNSFYYHQRQHAETPTSFSILKDQIVRRDLRTGREEVIYAAAEIEGRRTALGGFRVSPDGTRMALATTVRSTTATNSVLRLVDLKGGASKDLLRTGPVIWSWTPDGKRLVYSTLTSVWVVAVDAGEPIQLKLDFPNIATVFVHPDGRQLGFRSYYDARPELFVMEGLLSNFNVRSGASANK